MLRIYTYDTCAQDVKMVKKIMRYFKFAKSLGKEIEYTLSTQKKYIKKGAPVIDSIFALSLAKLSQSFVENAVP